MDQNKEDLSNETIGDSKVMGISTDARRDLQLKYRIFKYLEKPSARECQALSMDLLDACLEGKVRIANIRSSKAEELEREKDKLKASPSSFDHHVLSLALMDAWMSDEIKIG